MKFLGVVCKMHIDTRERIEDGTVQPQASMLVEDIYPKNRFAYVLAKRFFDVLFSACLLLLLWFPMLIVAAIIYLDCGGPVIYRQERLGKNGKPFMMLKYRTMRLDAEVNGPQWAEVDDPRCTNLGRFLRRCRVDELPQLWNILIGDMSFVGPRPERAYFYNEFEKNISGFRYRLRVTPGLTGLAQVNGGYDLCPEQKIVWDMEYIRKQSFWMDILCLVKTVKLIFTREGAR